MDTAGSSRGIGPLSGLRILAMTQVGAGPYAALQMADFGADVIKIEDPTVGGDSTRAIPPFAQDGDSLFFQSFNRNHRSVTLNLRTPAGRQLFHELVAVSDGLIANPRGDLVEKLGLNYAALGRINPRFVCCVLTGFGTTGPKAAEPAYDYLIQAMSGLMNLTGEPGGPPTRAGLPIIDLTAGLNAAFGLMMGLYQARSTGRGMDVETSLMESGLALLTYVGAWQLNGGFETERVAKSGHPSVVPCQNFEVSDGWIVVMCQKEAWWPRFCAVMEMPELAGDERFATMADRFAHRDILLPLLEKRFLAAPAEYWLTGFRQAGIPCGKINTLAEAMVEPQVLERGLLIEIDHPRFGTLRQIGPAVKMTGVETPRRPGPALGEHTDEVLRDLLHKSADEIQALRQAGAI